MTREEAYDQLIAPLMSQIIAHCKEHRIPMLCDFALDGDLKCTSALLNDDLEPPEGMVLAYNLLQPRGAQLTMITTTDKDGKVIAADAILG